MKLLKSIVVYYIVNRKNNKIDNWSDQMKKSLMKLSILQKGVALVEYALLLALIAVVCVTAVQSIGTNTQVKLNEIANKLQTDKVQ